MKLLRLISLVIACCGVFTFSHAVRTHSFLDQGFQTFLEGDLNNLALSNHGWLQTAPALRQVAGLDASLSWAAVPDGKGGLYVSTGPGGTVFQVAADGSTRTVFTIGQQLLRALAVDGSGNLWIGASPSGTLYRLPASGGPAQLMYQGRSSYIWSIEVENDTTLWLLTGLPARVIRIELTATGPEETVWFETGDDHFTNYHRTADGRWLLGSSGSGILYEVLGQGEGRALFKADDTEIRAISSLADGRIVFSTFNEPVSGRDNANAEGSENSGADIVFPVIAEGGGRSANAPRGRSTLFVLNELGLATPIWQSARAGVMALATPGGAYSLLGVNHDGRLFAVSARDNWHLIQRAQRGGDVSLIVADPGDATSWWVITSQPAVVYRLGGINESAARYVSRVRDSRQPARWGNIHISVEGGLQMSLETRTGNTERPDGTWSDWLATELTPTMGGTQLVGTVQSPPGRFLQYRLVDITGNGRIHSVRMFCQLPNLAPVFTHLRVVPIGMTQLIIEQGGPPALDLGAVFQQRNLDNFVEGPRPRPQVRRSGNPGMMTAIWQAVDGNGDNLEFTVELRRLDDSGAGWFLLAAELREPFFSFNTRGLSEGLYRIRVTATDLPDNDPDVALSSSRVSEAFLIDVTPPTIEITRMELVGNDLHVSFSSSDEWSVLAAAGYSLNGGTTVMLRPEGGLFDSQRLDFAFTLRSLPAGTHTLLLEVMDESGHIVTHPEIFTVR